MSTVLWLDDLREPWKHGFGGSTWVKTADEAIDALKTGRFTFASLDHDLLEAHYPWNCTETSVCDGTGCGCDVLSFLVKNPELWPVDGVRCHSANDTKRPKMMAVVMRHYGRTFV